MFSEPLSSGLPSLSLMGLLVKYLPSALAILILICLIYALFTKKLNPIKYVFLLYWIGMNLFGLFEICSVSCGITIGNVTGSLLYAFILIVPGAIFIIKSFQKEWYKKWWTYLVYFALITYPYIFVKAMGSLLCGCSKEF